MHMLFKQIDGTSSVEIIITKKNRLFKRAISGLIIFLVNLYMASLLWSAHVVLSGGGALAVLWNTVYFVALLKMSGDRIYEMGNEV